MPKLAYTHNRTVCVPFQSPFESPSESFIFVQRLLYFSSEVMTDKNVFLTKVAAIS